MNGKTDVVGEFTPGPWDVVPFRRGADVITGIMSRSEHEHICYVSHIGRHGRAGDISGDNSREEMANAHLIAAGPQMVDALALCVRALEDHLQYDDEHDSLERNAYQAAVAAMKATTGG